MKYKKEIVLKGINLGGWMMMEGYILGGRNNPESKFKKDLSARFGKAAVKEFTRKFRAAFITDKDLIKIKKIGFNSVRLPFNYRLIEEKGGLQYLKDIIRRIAKNKLYVILDMHAVPGSQNADWHSDSEGIAQLWEKEAYRKKYVSLWKKLSDTFKNEKFIAGYDIMNEPVTEKLDLLQEVYQNVIEAIRSNKDEHIIFLEGNNWAMDSGFIENISGSGLALSLHYYQPVNYVFNWDPISRYPGKVSGMKWDKHVMKKMIKKNIDLAKRMGMPLYCGEFGIVSRCQCCGSEYKWLDDVMALFKEFKIHWSYWTYKSVRGMKFPDGLFQLNDRSGLVGDQTTLSGMDNIPNIWEGRKNDYFKLLDTDNYGMNKFVYKSLFG